MTVTVVFSSTCGESPEDPPKVDSEISDLVRPSLSRHWRMRFCRTTRLPLASVMTVSLVPSAEYGAPVTSRTLLELPAGIATNGVAGHMGTSSARTAGSAAQTSVSARAVPSRRLQRDAIGRSVVEYIGGGHDAIDAHGAVVGDHDVDPVTFAGAAHPGVH